MAEEMTAARVLRRAREAGRLSQNDLARLAGVAQSVISAYESGHRDPALTTLAKLVEATGQQLVIDVAPGSRPGPGLPDTPLGRRLRRRRRAVLDVADRYGAANVRVFGSVARGEDTAQSDVDLLVDLHSGIGLVGLAGLARELSQLLGAPVDVVPADGLKPRVKANVEAEAISL